MSGDDVGRYLGGHHALSIFRGIGFWNGSRVRGELEALATNFAMGLYDALTQAALQRHGPCPPRCTPLDHPGLIITYVPPQPDIQAWRHTVADELAAGMAEGRTVLRNKCLEQITRRPWRNTFAPLMSAECVAVDRHGIGLYVYTPTVDLARPSIQVRPLKGTGLNLDKLERAVTRRPRVKRR